VTDISPQQVRSATFRTTRKGYDPDEVGSFLRATAEALEVAQNQSAAMEARARAAVARLQELSGREASTAPPSPPRSPAEITAPPDEAATISRTLLLAQRTADQTVAEARAEAERVLAAARAEAESTIDSTREMSARLVDEARAEARTATESERRAAEGEVMSLLARRDFLVADVDHLEAFLVEQRERIRDAAADLADICDRVPAGLAGVRRPLLSAAAGDATVPAGDDGDAPRSRADGDVADHDAADHDAADHDPADHDPADHDPADRDPAHHDAAERGVLIAPVDEGWPSGRSGATETDEATMAMPLPLPTEDANHRIDTVPTLDSVDTSDTSDASDTGDATPSGRDAALSFDASDLRRLGETRGLD
jgi:DivIVA domain-containing protein